MKLKEFHDWLQSNNAPMNTVVMVAKNDHGDVYAITVPNDTSKNELKYTQERLLSITQANKA